MKKGIQEKIDNITFVLAVYNNLLLTKEWYKRTRKIYPNTPIVISSGGSIDGTKEWLEEIIEIDDNLSIFHDDERLSFSETYNMGVNLVDTEKLVLVHNDMVISYGFLESIDQILTPDTLLSYTTIEPPIFSSHRRPGKILLNLGNNFDNFDYFRFDNVVQQIKNDKIYNGASFFMSGYKSMFEDIGGFDGFSFNPYFCEDDDFLIRAKIKGYKLKTCESAIVYHFVSQTSRFTEEAKLNKDNIELHSNRNFVRKWGISISVFNELRYWEDDVFKYPIFNMGLTTKNRKNLYNLEPYFDKIEIDGIPKDYIILEQKNTNYDLRSKFTFTDTVDVMVYENNPFNEEDYFVLQRLRLSIPQYDIGTYIVGNMTIDIKKAFN